MSGLCGTYSYADEEWCVGGLVGEALQKEALRGRGRNGDNIETDLQEMGWEGLDCVVGLRIGICFRT